VIKGLPLLIGKWVKVVVMEQCPCNWKTIFAQVPSFLSSLSVSSLT